jgi:hypothetical protein
MSPSQNGTHGAEEPPVIYTTDEEGVEHCFQMIDMIEVENQLYGLLLYLGEQEAMEKEESDDEGYDEEFVIMRIIEENGEQIFESIEDDEEFERVVAFVEQMDDEDEEE